jgi:DNA-binding transcriptional ArsR family regulator
MRFATSLTESTDATPIPEFRIPCIVWVVLTLASEVEVLARFGRALADPIRCRLLLALREAPAHPSDLAERLGISRTRLSNHLACLRDCGLVVAVPVGRRSRYELADPRLGHALDDLRTAVVAVETDRACADADQKDCC